ncbi:MAG: H-type lectin domain-containing protein [Thalassovita sp.]
MKKLRGNLIGIDQGTETLFSDFEDGGEMWTGDGYRDRRLRVAFSEKYKSPPSVTCSISLWDVDYSTNIRSEITTQNITEKGFEILFQTWGNTRIARAKADWMAIGEVLSEDDWDIP